MSGLVVAQVNVYVRNRHRRSLRRQLIATGAHVIGAQEAQRFGKIKGYVRLSAPFDATDKAREVAVYLRADLMAGYEGHSVRRVTERIDDKLAHDRWVAVAAFRHEAERYEVIVGHANAGVKGQTGTGPLRKTPAAAENVKLGDFVVRAARSARRRGSIPITLFDWNATNRNTGPGTPAYVHSKAQMGYTGHGVDGIGYDEMRLHPTGVDHEEAIGSDHQLLTATLGAR